MKLSNLYYVDEDYLIVCNNAGVELKTYLVGSFISAMFDAGLDALAHNLRITDFEVKHQPEIAPCAECDVWSVTLTSLSCEDAMYAYRQLREAEPTDDEWTLSD